MSRIIKIRSLSLAYPLALLCRSPCVRIIVFNLQQEQQEQQEEWRISHWYCVQYVAYCYVWCRGGGGDGLREFKENRIQSFPPLNIIPHPTHPTPYDRMGCELLSALSFGF